MNILQKYIQFIDEILSECNEDNIEKKHALTFIHAGLNAIAEVESELKIINEVPFESLGKIISRDSAGNEFDNPMTDDDPYLMLGQKLVTALSLLGAKQTCKYVKKIQGKELLLATGHTYQRYDSRKRRESKVSGIAGGMKTVERLQPLMDEIKRLFILVKNENPSQTLKYYTQKIQPDVDKFISLNPQKYGDIGSRDTRTGLKDTFGYINRKVSSMNKELKL
ncbi:hypothetical protein [uncultured Tolumonas sp.]|uniref:hypothetical protein n=1 Tax=uncultured Tolumonas sp. TaxID=263765 RepID=UPI002A0A9273|nr:hypothetical protein [uncultured Tolumonas sp.]